MSQYVSIVPVVNTKKQIRIDTIHFTLEDTETEHLLSFNGMPRHHIRLSKTIGDKAELVVSSQLITFTLAPQQTKQIDFDNDSINDIEVEVLNIINDQVQIDVHQLGFPDPNKIYFGEERQYLLRFFPPSYLDETIYNITLRINSRMVAVEPVQAGFDWQPFTEYRSLLFQVLEVDKQNVVDTLDKAREAIKQMGEAGFGVRTAKKILHEAEQAYSQRKYVDTYHRAQSIIDLRNNAFAADEIITQLDVRIQEMKDQWIEAPQTEQILSLAKNAFKREDYETALKRAKEAQLRFVIETKDQSNTLWFIVHYWWLFILIGVVLIIVVYWQYDRVMLIIIQQKLKSLDDEEKQITELKYQTQIQRFQNNKISALEYHSLIDEYGRRMQEINEKRAHLHHKRSLLFKTNQGLKNVQEEEKEVTELLRKAQTDYLQKGTIDRRHFQELYKSDEAKLAQLEEDKAYFAEQLAIKNKRKLYSCIVFLENCSEELKKLFNGKRKKPFAIKITPSKPVSVPKKINKEKVDISKSLESIHKIPTTSWNEQEKTTKAEPIQRKPIQNKSATTLLSEELSRKVEEPKIEKQKEIILKEQVKKIRPSAEKAQAIKNIFKKDPEILFSKPLAIEKTSEEIIHLVAPKYKMHRQMTSRQVRLHQLKRSYH